MTDFRISILIILTLSLVGCATTESNSGKGKYGERCQYLQGQLHLPMNSFDKKVDTSEKTELYDSISKKEFSGIQKVNLNGPNLSIQFIDKSLFEQYTIAKVLVIKENQYEAHYRKGMLGTLLTLGTIWIFAPQKYSDFTFGCTEQVLMPPQLDQTRKTKTGKSEWRGSQKTHKLLISGFDKDYERDGYYQTSQNQVEIDLSTAILNTDLAKKITVKISCLDCDLLGPEEQNIYKDVKKTVEITADFREIKATLVAKEKTRKIEQDQRDKEAIIQRVIDEKEDLQRRKETQGVPLAEFKAQCQALGFKVGSADYGNCVLELNDSK